MKTTYLWSQKNYVLRSSRLRKALNESAKKKGQPATALKSAYRKIYLVFFFKHQNCSVEKQKDYNISLLIIKAKTNLSAKLRCSFAYLDISNHF